MSGVRDFPSETSRDTEGYALIRTAETVTEEHGDYINSHDVVFSVFVHQLIEKRIEREQMLQQLEEGNYCFHHTALTSGWNRHV